MTSYYDIIITLELEEETKRRGEEEKKRKKRGKKKGRGGRRIGREGKKSYKKNSIVVIVDMNK